jgi:hypothetical protein
MILPNTTSNNTIDYYNYQQPEYSNYINNSHAPPPPLITDQLSMYPPSQAPLPSTTALDSPPQTLINSPPKPSSQTKTDKNKKPESKF